MKHPLNKNNPEFKDYSSKMNKKLKNNGQEQQNQEDPNGENPLIQSANQILPYLTPQELANISLTCKALSEISKAITRNRSLDASQSFEPNNPIPFHNTLDSTPYSYFLYTQSCLLPSQIPKRQSWGGQDPTCFTTTQDCPGEESGDVDVLSVEEMEMGIMSMSERGMTGKGVSVKLNIVRDLRKGGWGLFADQLICQGRFVCEYAGELLMTEEARRRQGNYDKLSSSGEFSSALLVVREHLPSGKACLRVNIDATRVGNVARFVNHSCDGGNLSTVVVRSEDALLPRLCFFASRDIKQGEELTFSYGEIRIKSKGLQCFCGSSCCIGTLPSEHT